MVNSIDRVNISPFLSQTTAVSRGIFPAGLTGGSAPASRVNFGHLAGRSNNGPVSLLENNPGEIGLGDRAIKSQNGELGRNLFIQA